MTAQGIVRKIKAPNSLFIVVGILLVLSSITWVLVSVPKMDAKIVECLQQKEIGYQCKNNILYIIAPFLIMTAGVHYIYVGYREKTSAIVSASVWIQLIAVTIAVTVVPVTVATCTLNSDALCIAKGAKTSHWGVIVSAIGVITWITGVIAEIITKKTKGKKIREKISFTAIKEMIKIGKL